MEVDFADFICNDCPRKCNALRTVSGTGKGFCGAPAAVGVVRAAPHFGEEPCISGTKGSGAVFFEGCNLRCIFCQNYEISRSVRNFGTGTDSGTCTSENTADVPEKRTFETAVRQKFAVLTQQRMFAAAKKTNTARNYKDGSLSETQTVRAKQYTPSELRNVLLRLRDTGVHNINLVTPTHYTRQLAIALDGLKLGIPVVWNSSGYESVESLKQLEGLVQIYMPDYKYARSVPAGKYSAAEDYPERAAEAIREMVRQTGPYRMDGDGILQSGVLIRHLVLPGGGENTENSMDVIDFVADNFAPGTVLFSLMSQYTPMPAAARFRELTKRVEPETMELLRHYMATRHLEDGYYQDGDSATGEMIPVWDGTGLL